MKHLLFIFLFLVAGCRTTKHTTKGTFEQRIKTETIQRDSSLLTAIALHQEETALLTIAEDFEVEGDCLIISMPQGHRIIGAKRIRSHRHTQQAHQAETTKQATTEMHKQNLTQRQEVKTKDTHSETHKVQETALPWYVWIILIALVSGWCWWLYRKS